MEIVRERQRISVTTFTITFDWKEYPGTGFTFDCTEEGVALLDAISPQALAHLKKCQDGTYAVIPQGVKDCSYTYAVPALGRCSYCNCIVTLQDSFANECKCGVLYNGFGQLLAPRSQWDSRGEY